MEVAESAMHKQSEDSEMVKQSMEEMNQSVNEISNSANEAAVAMLFKVLNKLSIINIDTLKPSDIFNQTKILLNSRWIGIHFEPDKLINQLLLYVFTDV